MMKTLVSKTNAIFSAENVRKLPKNVIVTLTPPATQAVNFVLQNRNCVLESDSFHLAFRDYKAAFLGLRLSSGTIAKPESSR
jgi:hypothetical protein